MANIYPTDAELAVFVATAHDARQLASIGRHINLTGAYCDAVERLVPAYLGMRERLKDLRTPAEALDHSYRAAFWDDYADDVVDCMANLHQALLDDLQHDKAARP